MGVDDFKRQATIDDAFETILHTRIGLVWPVPIADGSFRSQSLGIFNCILCFSRVSYRQFKTGRRSISW
jgi:hypothetical protein